MSAPVQLQVRLFPDGHLTPLSAEPDPAATWQVLGYTHDAGTMMGFVRAELAGGSWTTLVESAWLERPEREVRVTLTRQSDADRESLRGWILFC